MAQLTEFDFEQAVLAPSELARQFVIAAIWTNGAFWLLLGRVSAWVFPGLDGV